MSLDTFFLQKRFMCLLFVYCDSSSVRLVSRIDEARAGWKDGAVRLPNRIRTREYGHRGATRRLHPFPLPPSGRRKVRRDGEIIDSRRPLPPPPPPPNFGEMGKVKVKVKVYRDTVLPINFETPCVYQFIHVFN